MSIKSPRLSLIYNEKSGFHPNSSHDLLDQILSYWTTQGFLIEKFEISADLDMQQLMQKVLQRHQHADDPGVIVAAGGDGTLNAVASHLLFSNIPLAILPMGTFNYVARALNIPLDLLAAAEIIKTGRLRAVHVAKINQHIYLNNASLGIYPLFIKKRELYNQKFGRLALNAYTSGLDVLIRDRKELELELQVDQQSYSITTPLIFFGNNQLQLADMKLKVAECAKLGKIAGVVMAKSDKLAMFKHLFQLIQGQLDQAPDVYSFSATNVVIDSKQSKLSVAIDGEIVEMHPPLKIHVEHAALQIMVPYVDSSV